MLTQPTKISGSSATLLDNIFLSIPEETVSGIITCDISHHLAEFTIRKSVVTQTNPNYQNILKSNRKTNAASVYKLNKVLS